MHFKNTLRRSKCRLGEIFTKKQVHLVFLFTMSSETRVALFSPHETSYETLLSEEIPSHVRQALYTKRGNI